MRLAELALLVAQLRRALEVLVADRLLLPAGDLRELLLELLDLGRRHLARDACPRTRLVDDVDRLVGQEPVGDVAVGEPGRVLERLVGDDHPVVVLVVGP
jgi:hypothetical protein